MTGAIQHRREPQADAPHVLVAGAEVGHHQAYLAELRAQGGALRVDALREEGVGGRPGARPPAEWDLVPSAVLYVGQIRHLPPLVAGQPYLLRVASIGKSGKQSAWSDTVSITGK